MTARRKWLRAALLGTAVLVLAACRQDLPQNSLDPEGPIARQIDNLFWPVFWIAVAVFFLVEGLLLVTVVKFRRRPGRSENVRQVHGNTRLEIVWTLIPAMILAGVAVPTVGTIFSLAEAPGSNVMHVTVTAKQWWWAVDYPDLGVKTANEIHIPAGQRVYVTLKSEDVIHSFWVPKLAGTQDVVPGQEEAVYIEADEPGEYWGQCKEFCGASHANMRFLVVAQTRADFDAWVEAQKQPAGEPSDELAQKGLDLFMQPQLCIQCHAVNGIEGASSPVGPDLTHLWSRSTFAGAMLDLTEENLRRWLEDTPSVKPGSLMPDYGCAGESEPAVDTCLTSEDIDALIAYLQSLE